MKVPIVSAAGVFLSAAALAYAHGPDDRDLGPGMMGHWMMNWGYGMGWLWPLFMLVFWIAVIAGVVFLIRWLITSADQRVRGTAPGESALEVLKKRYARGEIDKKEFEEKKKDLEA